MDNIITYIVTTIIGLWLGLVQVTLKQHTKELSNKPDRKEVDHLINIKNESTKVEVREVREDIKRLEDKIDALFEVILNSKKRK